MSFSLLLIFDALASGPVVLTIGGIQDGEWR